VLANAKSSDLPMNNPSKVATSKVISLLARNNENYSFNKLYQTDPKFIFNGYIDL